MRFRTSRHLALALAPLAFATSFSSRAHAQAIDASTWHPSSDPAAGLVLEPVSSQGPGNFSAGAWASYAYRPLTLRNPANDAVIARPVSTFFGLDAVVNLGIGARASIGADVPIYLYQDGDSVPSSVVTKGRAQQTGIGDVALFGKVAIVDNKEGGFGLAALGKITAPTGDETSFMGDRAPTFGARLLAEYTLVVASVQASAGYTLRTEHRDWPSQAVGGVGFGDSIPWSFGISLKPDLFKLDSANRQRWDLAIHGSLPAGPALPFGAGDPGSAQLSPVLLSASDRVELGHFHDAYFVAGAELGLNSAVGVPIVRGVLAIGIAPRSHDQDGDGVPDDVDQCPEIAEDKDGFEDSDGCPEIDNDDDGVIDKEDACRDVAGAPSSDPKKNGCPAPDRDNDGIPDESDACPDVKGPEQSEASKNGCPRVGDRDHDGVPDDVDRCPDEPEDKDGNADEDGCPDKDDDGDGVMDREDACPRVAGIATDDAKTNGCPNPDRDGDTYDDADDKCPAEPETWNGVKDDDGCPDEGGKALVTLDTKAAAPVVRMGTIAFAGTADAPEIAKASGNLVRALAAAMNAHREWTLGVGVRSAGNGEAAQRASLARAGVIAKRLAELTHRDVAEAVAWDAVKKAPGAESGVGYLVLTSGAKGQAKPLAPESGKTP